MKVSLNADLGEGLNIESKIMPYLTSCSVACGGHVGDFNSMTEVVHIAIQHKVEIGAHPSYPDKVGFGRKIINISNTDLKKSIINQVNSLKNILNENDCNLNHIKTHGALYNLSSKDYDLAMFMIQIMKENFDNIFIYVPAGTLISELAVKNDLKIKKEVFLDRNYNTDNTLVSRNKSNALINSPELMFNRISNVTSKGFLTAYTGDKIFLDAETYCIHGDSPNVINNLMGLKSYLDEEI